jgi:hypothetical protein
LRIPNIKQKLIEDGDFDEGIYCVRRLARRIQRHKSYKLSRLIIVMERQRVLDANRILRTVKETHRRMFVTTWYDFIFSTYGVLQESDGDEAVYSAKIET